MKIAVDLNDHTLLDPSNLRGSAPNYRVGRNDTIPCEVVFAKNGVQTDLPTGATVKVQINKKGNFGGSGLMQGLTSTLTGSGPDAVYEVTLTSNTTEQGQAFVEDEETVSAYLQVEWAYGSNTLSSDLGSATMHNEIVV